MSLAQRLLDGDRRALARAITHVDNDDPEGVELLKAVYSRTGQATVVGVTGSPGSGKSSLVDRLIGVWRAAGRRVGVIAVDPSSAFSGGAILGDRVRMQDHAVDPDVFIRSMATRGHLGGLSRATNDAIDLFDAAGFDPVIVETVGVGQDEVEIVRTADCVSVVLVPGMGDDVQAIKAGILEIADLFVINKADRDGADRLEADLDAMLSLAPEGAARPAILRSVAIRGEGVARLVEAIGEFVTRAGAARRAGRRRERAESRLLAVLGDRVMARLLAEGFAREGFDETVQRIADRATDPYSAARAVLDRLEIRS